MATYYLRSGAAGAGTGADWANAYTTLATAISGKAAGDIIYVSEDHAESQATAISLSSSSATVGNPVKVICVNHLGSVPPVSADLRTTATVTTTGTSNITFAVGGSGAIIFQGITFHCGTGAGSAQIILHNGASGAAIFKDCSLRINSTGSGKILMGNGGNNNHYVDLINTTLSFGGTGQGLDIGGTEFRWRDTPSALLGTVPTTLFNWRSGAGGVVALRGVDLGAAGSGKTIIGNGAGQAGRFTAIDCKLNASVTKSAAPSLPASFEADFVRCGANGVDYNQYMARYSGTLEEETTIVRTGGASDGDTPLAWKISTIANASPIIPFESPPIAVWNDTVGSAVTATVEGIWGGGAVPNDDDIWIEAEYLGSNASPQASFVHDSKADILASAAGQTSSAATWGGSTTKFKMAVTFTPQQKGWVLVRVKAAKASSTFYIDPKVTLN